MSEKKDHADKALFTLLRRRLPNWSRVFIYHVVLELTRKWVALATTEQVRDMLIEFMESEP